jgi:hypothetical protein
MVIKRARANQASRMVARAPSLVEREFAWKKIVGDLDPEFCELVRKSHLHTPEGAGRE